MLPWLESLWLPPVSTRVPRSQAKLWHHVDRKLDNLGADYFLTATRLAATSELDSYRWCRMFAMALFAILPLSESNFGRVCNNFRSWTQPLFGLSIFLAFLSLGFNALMPVQTSHHLSMRVFSIGHLEIHIKTLSWPLKAPPRRLAISLSRHACGSFITLSLISFKWSYLPALGSSGYSN